MHPNRSPEYGNVCFFDFFTRDLTTLFDIFTVEDRILKLQTTFEAVTNFEKLEEKHFAGAHL